MPSPAAPRAVLAPALVALALMSAPSVRAAPPETGVGPDPAACRTEAPPPAGLEALATPEPVTAARRVEDLAGAEIRPGVAARVALAAAKDVVFPLAPAKAPAPEAPAGLVAFTVASQGVYRVALSSGAWIDVVGGGRSIPASGHAHGPPCSPARKIVSFVLPPGRYVLQVSGGDAASVLALVASAG